jgi:hypothetical protein
MGAPSGRGPLAPRKPLFGTTRLFSNSGRGRVAWYLEGMRVGWRFKCGMPYYQWRVICLGLFDTSSNRSPAHSKRGDAGRDSMESRRCRGSLKDVSLTEAVYGTRDREFRKPRRTLPHLAGKSSKKCGSMKIKDRSAEGSPLGSYSILTGSLHTFTKDAVCDRSTLDFRWLSHLEIG